MHLGIYELSTYKTTISDLQRRLTDRKYDELYYSGLPTANGSQNGKNNDNDLEKMLKEQKPKYETNNKRNDSKHQEMFAKKNSQESKQKHVKENRDLMKTNSPEYYGKKYPTKQNTNDNIYSEQEYERAANGTSFRYRSKWFCNLTNTWSFLDDSQDITELISTVWSYLSQNQTTFGKNGENWKHPTVKPVLLVNRLVKLLTEENDLVCDMFLGSGTTMVSCIQTNRKFIGCELQEQYFKICEERKYLEFKNQSEMLF